MNPQNFRADLHCHTTCSDGTDSPEEIVQLAQKKGLQGLAITDHDTIQAYLELSGKELPLPLLSGIELSATLFGESVHILAYGFCTDAPELTRFCNKHQQRRRLRSKAILKRLETKGISLNIPPLPHVSVGRPHIAQELMRQGYVQSIQEAFKKYIGKGRECYVPTEAFSVEETLAVIHEIKGLAIIAHPHLSPNQKVIDALISMPFDGIECYYARFPRDKEAKWLSLAKKKGWLITGGSDYHGAVKPQLSLGCSWVGEETFQILYDHYQNNLAKNALR